PSKSRGESTSLSPQIVTVIPTGYSMIRRPPKSANQLSDLDEAMSSLFRYAFARAYYEILCPSDIGHRPARSRGSLQAQDDRSPAGRRRDFPSRWHSPHGRGGLAAH